MFESINDKVKRILVCFFLCLYKIFVLIKVKYSKISHRISICQKLGMLEINALVPFASSAKLWLTDYQLPV